jgi:hypothetical protein
MRRGPEAVYKIWIDASRPTTIAAPFEVAAIGANAERGLWIGPGVGRGWKGEAGGEACYRFHVPAGGKYNLWAYCLWHDECTNAVYAEVDESGKAVIGNDPVFNQWHWVRGFSVDLSEGMHTLKLSNHSDNLAVQTVFVSNAVDLHPQGHVMSEVDLFFDGFDGCDNGNFNLWQPRDGQWAVEPDKTASGGANQVLVGKSSKTALIMLQTRAWQDYRLDVSLRPVRGDRSGLPVGICFGLQDDLDFWQLRWDLQARQEAVSASLVRRSRDGEKVVGTVDMPWCDRQWHDVGIAVDAGGVNVQVDGGKQVAIAAPGIPAGGIGLWLSGNVEAAFDSVQVRGRLAGEDRRKSR